MYNRTIENTLEVSWKRPKEVRNRYKRLENDKQIDEREGKSKQRRASGLFEAGIISLSSKLYTDLGKCTGKFNVLNSAIPMLRFSMKVK
ncbi:hypothetical protein DdX_12231 [Ditylenchus destructor]|uniref:Uncharacterized protein n=1 Tax=Ditylenchus destructor TaxID=166010 RepID=A0AAD4MWM3_9BILA|nr:hypothetical protein DdX_12231 [Ditylenchus destructor]